MRSAVTLTSRGGKKKTRVPGIINKGGGGTISGLPNTFSPEETTHNVFMLLASKLKGNVGGVQYEEVGFDGFGTLLTTTL